MVNLFRTYSSQPPLNDDNLCPGSKSPLVFRALSPSSLFLLNPPPTRRSIYKRRGTIVCGTCRVVHVRAYARIPARSYRRIDARYTSQFGALATWLRRASDKSVIKGLAYLCGRHNGSRWCWASVSGREFSDRK